MMKTMGEIMMTGRRRLTKPGPAMCNGKHIYRPWDYKYWCNICGMCAKHRTKGTKTEKETDLKEEKEEVKDLRA